MCVTLHCQCSFICKHWLAVFHVERLSEMLFVWAQQSNELCCLTGHSDKVTTVACTTDGTVCSGSLDRTVRLWKPCTAVMSADRFHNAEVTSVASSADGHRLATASRLVTLIFRCSWSSLPAVSVSVSVCLSVCLIGRGLESQPPCCRVQPWASVNMHVPLSPSSIIWYQPMGGDALRLRR